MTPAADDRDHYARIKMAVLQHLRSIHWERAVSRQATPLELFVVAAELGADVKWVQGAIRELIDLGLARPIDRDSGAHLAVTEGACVITPTGLATLHEFESGFSIAPVRPDFG